jgi:hypothetical protein
MTNSNPTTPPRTPRKNDRLASQNRANSSGHENGSKQKGRNKNRQKNAAASPAATRNDLNTPPLNGAQPIGMPSSSKPVATPSATAFAGPTFHASPAPSALPIPSFFSRSVPDSPSVKVPSKGNETSSSDSLTPPVPATNTPLRNNNLQPREESPLDFFFKADREQKERARSASSTQNGPASTGPFPLPSSPQTSQTPPITRSQNRPRHSAKVSSGGLFAMELDSDGARSPIGPAFSTPYSERINAVRTAQNLPDTQSPLDKSEALKAYLFSDQILPAQVLQPTNVFNSNGQRPQSSQAAYQNTHGGPRGGGMHPRPRQSSHTPSYESKTSNYNAKLSGRSSGLRQEVTPTRTPTKTPDKNVPYSSSSTPSRAYSNTNSADTNDFLGKFTSQAASSGTSSPYGVQSENRGAEILGMEESLRKLLKLDSGGGTTITGNVGSLPAAAVSVPNYVGGRPPPMNGMHNGVMGS